MATAEALKVSILGTLPNSEVWSVNPVYMLDLTPDVTWEQLNTLATAINGITVPAGILSWFNQQTRLTGVKLEARNRDGELIHQIEQTRATPVVGTSNVNNPMQTSVVASLRTTFPGGQGRGRLYWPATGGKINATTLRWDAIEFAALPGAVKTYLSAIDTQITTVLGACGLVVWSRTGTAFHTVNRILVGDVPDVQRRRRDRVAETYASTTFP